MDNMVSYESPVGEREQNPMTTPTPLLDMIRRPKKKQLKKEKHAIIQISPRIGARSGVVNLPLIRNSKNKSLDKKKTAGLIKYYI